MKLLVDVNLSPRWVDTLEAAGLSATHWTSVGAATASDSEILACAAQHGYVVITHDLDFGAILAASGRNTPSVVQVRALDLSPSAVAPQVVGAIRQLSAELAAGALVTVEPHRTRLAVLPLK